MAPGRRPARSARNRVRQRGRPTASHTIGAMFGELTFDGRGLIPVVAQDAGSGEVLTLAYANEESLRLTVETGELHFYSRSREEIWRKGETSGNVLKLRQLRYDCDGDAIVALVEPTGPACHTGERSCFHRDLVDGGMPAPAL